MKYVFGLPYHSCPPDPAFLRQDALMELCAFAEETGFVAANLTDHPMPTEAWRRDAPAAHDALDPFVTLAYVAAATKRMRLLTHVIVSPYRNPFLLAKTVATLDALSGGRLMLGLGIGYQPAEFAALGVNFEERNALFDEGVDAMKLAWTGEPVNFEGRHFSARGVTSQPTPGQKPHPPLWFGGNAKITFRRIIEHGQGWLILPRTRERAGYNGGEVLSIETLPAKVEQLRAMAKEAGRSTPIEMHFPIYATNGVDQTMKAEAVRELEGMGVGWVSWHGDTVTLAGQKDEIRRFADEVMSKVPPTQP